MSDPSHDLSYLADNLQQVRQRIDEACRAAGRSPAEVTLLPVSKTFGTDVVRAATGLGLRRFGENKVQEIRDKSGPLADCHLDWVMIGHLQTNKAKDVARLAAEVQSLDRLELAEALDRRLQIEGRTMDVLVQVKTSSEESKYGLPPEELLIFLERLRSLGSLRPRGLMTLAIHSTDPDEVRACFRQLRQLRDLAVAEGFDVPRLSMGMSGDFPIAIAEGATEIRIGTSLFGQRPYPDSHYWPEK